MDADERREQIIAATRRVMADFGVRRATVGDVAKEAGLSRQTVYEYFPSREALVQGALVAGAQRVVQGGAAAAEERGGSASDLLATMLSTSLQFLRESGLWSTSGKRAELAPFVALEGTVFLGAGSDAVAEVLGRWWPGAPATDLRDAADLLARVLVSHGLAPDERDPAELGVSLARLVALGLDGLMVGSTTADEQ